MVEKHVEMEDNLMGSEDCKLVDGIFLKGDKKKFHEEDKVVVVLEDVPPRGIGDFLRKECAKDFVSHSVHTTCYGLQSEIAPQDNIVSPFDVGSQMEFSPQHEVEFLEGSGIQK
jgi:hypothetical protein